MNKNLFSKFNWRGGQSLLEAVLALAIFAFIAGALVTTVTGSFISLNYGRDYLEAVTLADEALEAARSVRDGAWNELVLNTAVATSSSGEWQLLNGASETLGKFTRTLTFAPGSGGPSDLHAKLVSAKVVWPTEMGVEQEVARQTYLTNWDSRDFIDTDWTDLVGINIDTNTAGEIKLVGSPAGWSLSVDTGTQTWNDVWVLNDRSAWVVGNGGVIYGWDGSGWSGATSPTGKNLRSLACPQEDFCFAVGQSGVILHWTGGSWASISSPTNQQLNSVFCLSKTSCVAAGNSGTIIRWDGASWSLPANWDTGNQTWNGIFLLSDTEGFVVGNSGTIWALSGTKWGSNANTGNQTWNDVWMFGSTSGLVFGSGGRILRYRGGGNWSAVDGSAVATLNSAVMLSENEGWAVGQNSSGEVIYQRTPSGWQRVGPSPSLPNVNLFGVHCGGTNLCFAVGAGGNIFIFSGGGFAPSGLLTSTVFDLGDNSPVQILEWMETGCGGCDVEVRVHSGDSVGGPWTNWTNWFNDPAGTILPIVLNGHRFVQYEARLTGPGTATPVLQEVRINYK